MFVIYLLSLCLIYSLLRSRTRNLDHNGMDYCTFQPRRSYFIKGMFIDNGAFTLAAASKVLTTANYFRSVYGQEVNETWDDIANNVAIPYDDSGITIEYEGMNNSVPIKQADVILSTYPFDYRNNYTEEQSLMDLDYVSHRQSSIKRPY